MSSEDVIELGSSDEEPAPKKSKPRPDAMVCIPRKLHDVTIKLANPNPSSIAKGLGKAITVKKINNKSPPCKSKLINGRPVQIPRSKYSLNPLAPGTKPVIIQNKLNIGKVPLAMKQKIVSVKPAILNKPIKIQNSGPLNLLPPSITVKKTALNKPIVKINVKNTQQINQKGSGIGDVLTVELDDDEGVTPKSSPQWYVRPEHQMETSALEEQNNKEPDVSRLIEITIEDSPVKSVINKNTHTVGAELAITIDDSPVKAVVEKNISGSDSEKEYNIGENNTPRSKKQLIYPKEIQNANIVEIEIEPHEMSVKNCNDLKTDKEYTGVSIVDDKKSTNENTKFQDTEFSTKIQGDTPTLKDSRIVLQNNDSSEFHPVYQSFIDVCFELENSEDMKTIVEKKIKGYYKQVPKEYTESEEFTDMVSSKILSMKAGPEKMYLYIKDVVDELNLQRKLAKAQPVVKEKKTEEPIQACKEESEYDSKRQRQIRKLEKTIKKLHRAIQKLEEQEVDFDDEDDSVYLLTERYKERMVRVYAKFCQLSNTKMPSEPRIQIDSRPGHPSGPAKRLEKWINKKVPIGTPLPFPDFHDVLRCVREANEEDKLNFNEIDILEEARDLFTRCGKKLQRRRQENEWRLAASRIALDVDPAEDSEELKRKLNDNRKVAAQKETEIFNKFADRQSQMKLEAEEIGDKEAEESPVESEEEEGNDDGTSLKNTEKRKERLKRLLQEKSKKNSEEKESNKVSEENNTIKASGEDGPKNASDEKECKTTLDVKESCKEMEHEENQTTNENERNINDKRPEAIVVEENTTSKLDAENEESQKQDAENINENVAESNKAETSTPHATETFTLSDDSDDLESDIDELHLLQKLHSGNEDQSSSADSSDSESPIAISDSLGSSDDCKKAIDDDIISIENSSYSENEPDNIEDSQHSNTGSVHYINDDSMPSQCNEKVTLNEETLTVNDVTATNVDENTTLNAENVTLNDKNPTPNDENAMDLDLNSLEVLQAVEEAPIQPSSEETVENILLASSEEDNCDSQEESTDVACFNLRDDLISIDETVIGNDTNKTDLETDKVSTNARGVNIENNIIPTNHIEVKDTKEQSNTNSQVIDFKSIDQIFVDEVSQQPIEVMEIDDESIILDTPTKNIPESPTKSHS